MRLNTSVPACKQPTELLAEEAVCCILLGGCFEFCACAVVCCCERGLLLPCEAEVEGADEAEEEAEAEEEDKDVEGRDDCCCVLQFS